MIIHKLNVEIMVATKVATVNVDRILKNHNIQRNSQSWFDYSKAKEVIFGDDWLKDHRHYNQIIKEICDYLGI